MADGQQELLVRKAALAQKEELTVQEAAEYSDMGVSTLALYAKLGRIQARRIGHMWLLNTKALETYLRTPHKPGVKKGTKRKAPGSAKGIASPGQETESQTEDAA